MSLIQRECTPALSPSAGERGNRRQSVAKADAPGIVASRATKLPLPRRGGEGRGEGEQAALLPYRST